MSVAESLRFWDADLEPAERSRRAVAAQKEVFNSPVEVLRRSLDLVNVQLYEQSLNATLYNFAGNYLMQGGNWRSTMAAGDSSQYNVAKAAIDTLLSQVASTDQRARFLTTGGNYLQRRRARKIQEFVDGLAHELRLHILKKRAFLDACILESGVGCIQFYREDDKVCAQRVIGTELSVDPMDGWLGDTPRTLYRRRPVSRELVKANWGGKNSLNKTIAGDKTITDNAIDMAPAVASTVSAMPSDKIEVLEAWHLPSAPNAKDGWHVISVDHPEGVLMVDEYKRQRHEIVWFSTEDRFTSIWGNSPMSQVRALQRRINANLVRIERSQKLLSAGHIYINKGAKVQKSQLTNEIGTVWEGSLPPGEAIGEIKFQGAPPELVQQVATDAERIFEVLGINRGASQGEHNLGLDVSAAALREDKSRADNRNAIIQQRWEQFHLDCVRVAVDIVREIASEKRSEKKKYSYRVTSPLKKGLSVVDWKEAEMDEADYVLSIHPASPVPTDPAGLIAMGKEMVEVGAWTPDVINTYWQDLDASAQSSEESSQREMLESTFEKLLYDKSASETPDEFTDGQLAIKIGAKYLAMGKVDGVPPKHLDRLLRYLRKCQKLAKDAAAQAAQAQAAMNPAPVTPPQSAPM